MENASRFHVAFGAGVVFLVTLGSFSTEGLAIVGWIGTLTLIVAWLVFAFRIRKGGGGADRHSEGLRRWPGRRVT